MKVCPKCQASFAEGFVYCPADATALVRYDLRARVRVGQADELLFLFESDSLLRRLWCELQAAASEFRYAPRAFVHGLWRGEGSTRRRRRLLQSGAALAVIAYTFVVTALSLLGLMHSRAWEQIALAAPPVSDKGPLIQIMLPLLTSKSANAESTRGHLGGSLAQARRAHGGGSGGDKQAKASGGVLPRADLAQQLRLPDPAPPQLPEATLLTPPTIVADPIALKFAPGIIGLPGAPPAPPAKGSGEGGGIGNQQGRGVGAKGVGDGAGPGNQFNTGNGQPSIGGQPTTDSDDGEIFAVTRDLRPTILYREKARYTEEARQQKIQGTVVLSAVFTATGQLAQIRVIRGLPFGLTEEAMQAARRILFQPALRNGAPVSVRAQLEYNFALY